MSVSKTGVPCNVNGQAGTSHGPRIQNDPIADVRYEGIYPALADNGIRMRNYFHVCLSKGWSMQATFPSITLYFTKHQMW